MAPSAEYRVIGKVMKGRGFAGLARYLETGRDGTSPDRVEWIEARNLPTNDPHTASLLMRATAAQSVRVQKPVYHIALSFDPDDGVDRAAMVRVADRLLNDLGLDEHQALIVAHGDTRHAHVHLMINRVHPETFRAWDHRHDYARIERSLREQESEMALRAVPGHHFRLEGQQRPDRSNALTAGQLYKWERTGELPFDNLVRATVRQDAVTARSWSELEARLSEKGLRIEARGRGLVVTDGNETARASRIGPELWRRNLEQRFGAMNGDRHEPEQRSPAREHSRTDGEGERVAGAAARNARAPAEPSGSHERNGGQDVTRSGRDGGSHHDDTARHGAGAHRPQCEADASRGAATRGTTTEADRNRAEPDVRDRTAPATSRSDRMDADERDRTGADRRDAGRRGRGARGPQLDTVRRTIDALERRTDLENVRDRTAEQLDSARSRLRPFEAQRAEARDASRRFDAALSQVYRDPIAARRAFEEQARDRGDVAVAAKLGRYPERFGALRGTQVGPVRSEERKQALRGAVELERLGAEHLRGMAQTSATRDQYQGLNTVASHLDQRVKQLDAKLARGPGSATLRHRLERQLRALQPARRQALRRSLPISKQRLFTTAMMAARAFAQEQGHER